MGPHSEVSQEAPMLTSQLERSPGGLHRRVIAGLIRRGSAARTLLARAAGGGPHALADPCESAFIRVPCPSGVRSRRKPSSGRGMNPARLGGPYTSWAGGGPCATIAGPGRVPGLRRRGGELGDGAGRDARDPCFPQAWG